MSDNWITQRQIAELIARAEAAERERDALREVLAIFADDENWRYGRRLDANGSRFDGTDIARAALEAKP